MADSAELARMARRAHDAGDAEGARRLVAAYQRQQALEAQAQPAPAAPEPSWLQRRGADLKANARAAAEGIGGAIGIVTDPFAQGLQGLSNMVTGNNTRAMTMAETFGAGAEAAGLPALDPNSAATPIMRGVYGTLPTLGAGAALQAGRGLASTTAQRVGETLAARPTMQLVSGGAAAGAADMAGDAGAGPGGQLLAGLAGGLAPAGLQAGVQRALTGGDVARFARNVDDFQRIGTTPTVGQASQAMPMRAVEVGLSRAPGSAMQFAATGQRQADEIGMQVGRVADRLSTRGDAASAGRAIERGIAGRTHSGQPLPDSFMGRTGRTAGELYARVDAALPGETSVPLNNLRRAVSEISAEIPDAPLTAGATSSPFIRQFAQSLDADLAENARMGMNGMRYSSVKALRSRIGEQLDTAALNPDINVQQLRRIYGAFSEDMNAAARAAGPEAERAMIRANNYFRFRINRLENIERVVQANGGPERVFASAMSGSREGGTTITQVMRSLPEESQRIVASTVLRRLGTAVASQQDDTGQVFNLSTFLTNWNRLHPSARSALFSRFDGQIGRDLNSLGRVASNVREGSMIFPNPAGTAAATLQLAAGSGIVGSVLTGNLPAIGYVMAGLASANASARLMTNPSFVRWLAVSQNLSPPAFQASLQSLAATARRENDADTLEFAERLQAELQNAEQAPNGQQREAANR